MATCPDCGASSPPEHPTFVVERVLLARPICTWSLAGAQPKVSAVETMRLRHNTCGWTVYGDVVDGHFVARPELAELAEQIEATGGQVTGR